MIWLSRIKTRRFIEQQNVRFVPILSERDSGRRDLNFAGASGFRLANYDLYISTERI
jgi:hypothetical protein